MKRGYMEMIEADPRPFLPSAMCFEARYYHDDLGPFTFFGVNQNGRPHGVTAQRLIENGLASSLEDWNKPFVLNLLDPDVYEIITLLHEFRDCFAWHYHEMPGLDRKLVEHRLPIKEGYLPVKQARRRMSMDTELKDLRGLRNLNDASPKDEYPMPMADMLVDGAAHNRMLSFMDGNAGYNRIMMAEEDIHKTAFMCPGHIGAFEYTCDAFWLKKCRSHLSREQ
ncbi:unnamed protein product [Prunus brigantina]